MAEAKSARWRIVSQTPQSGRDAGGNYTPGIQVTVALDSGSSFHMFVPNHVYSERKVHEMASERAAEMARVDNLTAESMLRG